MIRLGIYAGSFNPFHNGHYNIFQKACNLFDEVIIAVGINPDKEQDVIEAKQDVIGTKARLLNDIRERTVCKVEHFCHMLHEFIIEKEKEDFDVTLVRGLRNGYDLDYEMNQYQFLQKFKPDIKVVYIPCDKQFEHISSSALRGIQKFQSIEEFLPARTK